MKHEADIALARKLIKGDQLAFDEFFDRYYPRLFRFCQKRVNDNDVEDLVLTSLRQALRRIETYRGEATLLTWITQVARSLISKHYQRNAKHESLVLIDDSEAVQAEVDAMASHHALNPEHQLHNEERTQLIHLLLDHLPGNYGTILEWKYIQGYSIDEIATRLDASPTAIQSMIARARNAFKDSYAAIQEDISTKIVPLNPTGDADA